MINFDMNDIKFKVSGYDRKQLKKRLFERKRFVDMAWYNDDIAKVHGWSAIEGVLDKLIADEKQEIERIENLLKETMK